MDAGREASRRDVKVLAVTGRAGSALGGVADAELVLPTSDAELIGNVPSRSIVLAESAVNGVLSAIAGRRALGTDDFKRNHPGGAIGRAD